MIKYNLQDTFNKLHSINHDVIIKAFKKEKIHIVIDSYEHCLATFNVGDRTVFLDEQFVWTDRDYNELSYILLHQYYNAINGISNQINKDDYFSEFARFVFEMNKVELPEIFKGRGK